MIRSHINTGDSGEKTGILFNKLSERKTICSIENI